MPRLSSYQPTNSIRSSIRLAVLAVPALYCGLGLLVCFVVSTFLSDPLFIAASSLVLPAPVITAIAWWLCGDAVKPIETATALAQTLERNPGASLPPTTGTSETDELLQTLQRVGCSFETLISTIENAVDGKAFELPERLSGAERLNDSLKKLSAAVALDRKTEREFQTFRADLERLTSIIAGNEPASALQNFQSGWTEIQRAAESLNLIADGVSTTSAGFEERISGIETASRSASNAADVSVQQYCVAAGLVNTAVDRSSKLVNDCRSLAESAGTSAAVAAEMSDAALLGLAAARQSADAMAGLRTQAHRAAKRIKSLGERVQEIGQVVGQLDGFVKQTDLLSLNTSLKTSANAGGSSGDSFALEIGRLSERGHRLAKQVASATRAMTAETAELSVAIEQTVQDVIVTSDICRNTSKLLETCESLSSRVSEDVIRVFAASGSLSRDFEEVCGTVSGIQASVNAMQTSSRAVFETLGGILQPTKNPTEAKRQLEPENIPGDGFEVGDYAILPA